MFAFFPAGLVLYWVTNTVLSIAQQWNINRRIEAAAAAKRATRPALEASLAGAAAVACRSGKAVMTQTTPSWPRRRRRAGAASASCASRDRRRPQIAAATARASCRRRATPPSRASSTRTASAIDAGLALFFPAPHSYTGEHVLELHGHGGPVVHGGAGRARAGARRAPRAAGRVHAARLPQRQARPGAGRGDRGSDRCGLARGGARGDALAAGGVLRDGARAHRGGDRAAHLRRGGHRLSRKRRSTSSPTASSASASRRCAITSRACSTARARGGCCARA